MIRLAKCSRCPKLAIPAMTVGGLCPSCVKCRRFMAGVIGRGA